MDDWRSPSVKKVEALQDLSTPAPQHFNFHHLEPLQISTGKQIILFTRVKYFLYFQLKNWAFS